MHLPGGVVSFVFFDMVGSTKRCRTVGTDAFAALLAAFHRGVASCFSTVGGVLVQLEGDGGFGVVTSPAAVPAFADALHELTALLAIDVRIGVHSTEAFVTSTGYVGEELHRAARIAAMAAAGQVLISSTTAALLPASIVLRDLGEHHLKDFPETTRLLQIGTVSYGPLRGSLSIALPVLLTPTIGREVERSSLVSLLRNPLGPRFVTVTGPGGVGKTRMATDVVSACADVFVDGLWWVSLAEVPGPSLVAPALAKELGLIGEPGRTPLESVCARVNTGRCLLVLDNAEHVLDGVAGVAVAVAQSCPNARVLSTSRSPLRTAGERVVELDVLQRDAAIALFVARAEEVGAHVSDDDLGPIDALCGRLDDLPLALELAAARLPLLGLHGLATRLDAALVVLGSNNRSHSSDRQRTMRATIAWSVGLLKPSQTHVLLRLATFPAGARLEVIEAACDAELDDIEALVEHHLARMTLDADGVPRFRQLVLVREYSLECLEASGQSADAWQAASKCWALLGEESTLPLYNERDADQWIPRLGSEMDNFRAALDWTGTHDSALHIRLTLALAQGLLGISGITNTALFLRHLPPALTAAYEGSTDASKLLYWLSAAHWLAGDMPASREYAQRSVTNFEVLGDQWWRAAAFHQLALTNLGRGTPDEVLATFEAARHAADASGNVREQVTTRLTISSVLCAAVGEVPGRKAALRFAEEALHLARQSGLLVLGALTNTAEARSDCDDMRGAAELWLEALQLPQLPHYLYVAAPDLAELLAKAGRRDLGRALFSWATGQARLVGLSLANVNDTDLAGLGDSLSNDNDPSGDPHADIGSLLLAISRALLEFR